MEYRTFGSTGLTVSAVGFGCARLGGVFGGSGRADAVATLRQALDVGITFYDTADIYAQGESERLVGEAFHGCRDRVVIATKVGYCLPPQRKVVARIKPLLRPLLKRAGITRKHVPTAVRGALTQDFSPNYLIRAAEASLKRLRSDYIDVYQLHSPPALVLERGEFIEPLERLKREGKIRHYGVACETVTDALLCLRYPGVASVQVGLSLLHQEALDAVVPQAVAEARAVIARQCYASGQLAKPSGALHLEQFVADVDEREARRAAIARLQGIADLAGRDLPELALQFVHSLPGIAVTLVGMRTAAHLVGAIRYLAAPLTTAEQQAVRSSDGA